MIDQQKKWNAYDKWETIVFWSTLFLGLGFLLYVAFNRLYFNYGTETDTLSGFIPEAKRILAGQPLALNFHPPLYSFALSITYLLTGNWLHSGIAISILCAGLVLLATYHTVKPIVGTLPAAWACIVIITSPIFLSFATQATSDLCFYALYSLAIWSTFHSLETNSKFSWLASGFLIALTILTRSNGIVLLLLTLFPLLANSGKKTGSLSSCWLGIIACCGIWIIYALLTDSNLMPASNHKNIAMTYFGTGDRISNESFNSIANDFNSLFDVLMHDPKVFVITYAKDLYLLFSEKLYTLLVFPFSKLAFAGVLLTIILCWKNRNLFLFVSITAAHILLINLKTFEPRYYLFLLPLLGIGIGILIFSLLQLLPSTKLTKFLSIASVAGFVAISLYTSQHQVLIKTYKYYPELEELLPTAKSLINSNDIIIARKSVLGFYTNATTIAYPDKISIDELQEEICSNYPEVNQNIWLFYGVIERYKRPQYQDLLNSFSYSWLEFAGQGTQSKWVLYKVTCKNI